jgi:hemolysin activation/secretion protein
LFQFAKYSRHPLVLALSVAAITIICISAISFFKSAERAPTTPPPETKKLNRPTPPQSPVAKHRKQTDITAKNTPQVPPPSSPETAPQEQTASSVSTAIPPAPVAQKNCFKIDRLLLEVPPHLPERTRATGASTLPLDKFRFAQDELETYAGQCIGRDDLNTIMKKLNARILDKGYTTTRIGIPEQNLSSGTLKITLVPGMIHAIRFEPDNTAVSWKTAFPVRPGELLNLRDLEQGLEQIKRVPSQDADMQIVPGDSPGESDVVINRKHGPSWKLTTTLDDAGTDGTGKLQGSLNLSIDNLLGINDLFNMGINNDAGNNGGSRGTQGNNAYYSMPFGNFLFTLSGSNYQYHQKIAGIYQTFVSSGESNNLELKLSYLLHRDQNSKSTIQIRTAKRWNTAFIDDTEIAVQRRHNTLGEISLTHKHNIGQSQLEITLSQRSGMHWFGAQEDMDNRQESDPTFFYELSLLDASLSIPFTIANHPYKNTITLRAQTTDSSVYASEYIAIGNRWTVRGFDGETSLAAERGWFIRNEYETPLAASKQSAYIGLDIGMVYGNNVANLVGDHLAGIALGMRGSLFQGMFYDVFAGWQIYKPENFTTSEPAAGFSMSYQI